MRRGQGPALQSEAKAFVFMLIQVLIFQQAQEGVQRGKRARRPPLKLTKVSGAWLFNAGLTVRARPRTDQLAGSLVLFSDFTVH